MLFPQASFFYQNIVAAHKILELIDIGSPIKSIELDNPSGAKHIDDIIVRYEGFTRYYQVKWSSDERKSYTLHNLITASEDESKSLIQQLAKGYSELADRENAEIILYSTRVISNRKQPSQGIDHSLQEFIEDVHSPFVNSPTATSLRSLPRYKEYESAIQLLLQASGLPDEETFCKFLKRLRFELNQDGIDTQREQLLAKLDSLGIERTLYDSLLNAVVEWSIPPRRSISASDVLKRLGLADRFVDRVAHDFKVEEQHYVENTKLFEQLDQSIAELDSGFVLIEGPPGSGKSTALTIYQRQRENVRFAYYCFIPDEITLGNPRLERETFLKSLCIGIQNSFPDIDFPQPYSQDYERKLDKWLHKLSQLGTKVIFIVDGLDHVDRKKKEQLVRDPLTNALDGKLPNNVLFILSSQYPEALSTNIQDQIKKSPLRYIKIAKFSEAQIELFLRLRRLNLSDKALAIATEKSEGIPLYLHYIANILADTPSYAHESVLEELPALTHERIDSYHSYLYEHLAPDELTVYILALLAQRKEYTITDTLLELLGFLDIECTRHQLEEALKTVKHLLKISDASSYTIYHDSFRGFILEKTRHLGNDINLALIRYYEANPNADETYRHFYRHLFELGRYEQILKDCDEAWLHRSWQAFRPSAEIDFNLDIAWQAAVQLRLLKEIIRIAFLKQRLGLITLNVEELNDFNFAQFLLAIGKSQDALRALWDGERVHCSPIELAEFILSYREKTGHLLPKRIAEIGLTEPHKGTGSDDLKTYYQALVLYTADWRDLFDVVSNYQWQQRDHPLSPYTIQQLSPTESTWINNSIKVAMVEGLYIAQNYDVLLEIAQDSESLQDIRNEAIIRCIQLLLAAGETKEAIKLLDLVNFCLLKREQYNHLLMCLAENRCLEQIQGKITLNYLPPSLFSNLVKEEADFGIKEELLSLYENLRVHFLQNPNGYDLFMLKASTFDMPERGFFSALIELAKLWCDTVRDKIEEASKLQKVKQISEHLNIDRALIRRTLHEQINDAYYIGHEVHKIYANIFAYVAKSLAPHQIMEVVNHWLILDAGPNGYKSYHTNIEFAKLIKAENHEGLETFIKRLLDRAKSLAKSDEDTAIRVNNLLTCAEAYGYCGFEKESIALWDELFVLACGVGSHKDYQFNAVLPALHLAHKAHPEKSLERLARLLTLAHQVPYGTDIEALIAFSSRISPELALELLYREDEDIFREDAIQRLVMTWTELPNINLRYVWAVVKTMNKWEDYRAYNTYTYPTMLHIFEQILSERNLALAQEIYSFARHQFLVEKENPAYVFEFAEKCKQFGIELDTTESDIRDFRKYKEQAEEKEARQNSFSQREQTIELSSFEELHELSEDNFDGFAKKMQDLREQHIRAERERELNHAYYDLKRVFTAFYEQLPDDVQAKVGEVAFSIARQYAQFKKDLLFLPVNDRVGYAVQVTALFERLVSNIGALVPETGWDNYVQNSFDLEQWLGRFTSRSFSDYWFRREVLHEYIIRLVEQSSLKNLTRWEQFCRTWLDHYDLTKALTAIAKRLRTLNPSHCYDLLTGAWTEVNDLFYYSRDSAIDLLGLLFEIDPEKAKGFLLESFYHQYRKYGHQIVYKLGLIVEFADQLGDEDISEYLYQQYEIHNEHLAQGLAPKDLDYQWVAEYTSSLSFEDATILYLVRLFDRPEVEIRKLALRALYDLIEQDTVVLTKVLDFCRDTSDNAIEHVLSLVFSVAIADPSLVMPHKGRLFECLEQPHFSIKQTAKEILLYCLDHGMELELWEIDKIAAVNRCPHVHLPILVEGELREARPFLPSKYQSQLVYKLYDYQGNDEVIKKLYTRVLRLCWDADSGMRREGEVHRRHNINTNFDNIEINGPYFQVVQKALNMMFSQEIQEQIYEDGFIQKVKNDFRLYDPTDLFVTVHKRPESINWIDPEMSDEDFLAFDDIEEKFLSFLNRDEHWITLYEDGHQRAKDEPSLHDHKTNYFRVVAFLVSSIQYPNVDCVKAVLHNVPFIAMQNCYRFEVPHVFPASDTFPVRGIKPIIGISENHFRGQDELSISSLLPDFIQELGISRVGVASLDYHKHGDLVVEFINWQEAFDQGRRRQKPKSAGVLLKIRKDVLKPYLDDKDYTVYFVVHMKRSTDRYSPEEDMDWKYFTEVYQAKVS